MSFVMNSEISEEATPVLTQLLSTTENTPIILSSVCLVSNSELSAKTTPPTSETPPTTPKKLPKAAKNSRGSAIKGEARKVIINVAECCDREKEMKMLLHPLSQSVQRAATYCGVSETTVRRIRQFCRNHPGETPRPGGKKRPKCKGKVELDDFDRAVVRRAVEDFYLVQKVVPRLRKLRPVLERKIGWSWSITSLRKMLLSSGFVWKKVMNKRTLLLERANIVDRRSRFLVKMRQLREASTEVFYLDEWWIDNNLTCGKCWQKDELWGASASGSASERLIMGIVGSKNGFLKEAQLQFWAKTTQGDSHGPMNSTNFEMWFEEMVLPQIPPHSVIVMGNAPYHSRQIEKTPSRYDTKVSMVEWLRSRNITCNENMRKVSLYDLIRANKPSEKLYVVDALAEQFGHMVLRLPPYSSDLNAVELAWAKVTEKFMELNINVDMSCEDLVMLADESLLSVTEVDWRGYCRKVQRLEEEYWRKDGELETAVDDLIMSTVECDSEESEESESDEESSGSE